MINLTYIFRNFILFAVALGGLLSSPTTTPASEVPVVSRSRVQVTSGQSTSPEKLRRIAALIQSHDYDKALTELKKEPALLGSRDGRGRTPLLIACSISPVNALFLRKLLQLGAKADTPDHQGTTPLIQSVLSNSPVAVSLLLAKGAHYDLRDHLGRSALREAAMFDRVEIGRMLVSAGAKADIFEASALGLKEQIKGLLDRQPSLVNARDETGRTPIEWAAVHRHEDIVRLILSYNSSLDIFAAAASGQIDVVKKNLNAASPDSFDSFTHLSALQWAVLGGHKDVVEFLLASGADANVGSEHMPPTAPLVLAIRKGDKEVVQLLLGHGAKSSAFYPGFGTPYTIALASHRPDIAELLR
jgi:ankyrin repeat protein